MTRACSFFTVRNDELGTLELNDEEGCAVILSSFQNRGTRYVESQIQSEIPYHIRL